VYRIGQKKPVYIHYILSIHPDFKDDSFDKSLHKLLEGKRNLSNKVLLPIPNNDSDSFSNLIKNTFKHGKEVSLNDTYSFDETGLDFENLVFNKLNENASSFGYLVRKTQKSYDGGADMIIQSIDNIEDLTGYKLFNKSELCKQLIEIPNENLLLETKNLICKNVIMQIDFNTIFRSKLNFTFIFKDNIVILYKNKQVDATNILDIKIDLIQNYIGSDKLLTRLNS
jgi:hypothetical protein